MKKLSIFNRQRFTTNSFYVFCIFFIFLLSGCGGGSDDSFSSEPSETASASFTIAWHNDPLIQAAGPEPEPVDCSIIKNIICKVYDGSDLTSNLTSDVFDCYGGEGTIEDIPVGDNREFFILGEDADGNILYHGVASGKTIEKGQNEIGNIDTYYFVPKGLYAEIIFPGEVRLEWDGTNYDGVEGCNVYRNGELLKSTNTTATSAFLSPINQKTCFTVTAYDAADNESFFSNEACIAEYIDIDPPTRPEYLSATAVSSSQINLVWDASIDNVGVTGYYVYQYEELIDNVTSTSYSDTNLSPSTEYCYSVSAYDSAELESEQSNPPVCATTPESDPFPAWTDPTDATFERDGGAGEFTVWTDSYSCEWEIYVNQAARSWIRIDGHSCNYRGNGAVQYHVLPHTGSGVKNGWIQVRGPTLDFSTGYHDIIQNN